MALSNRSRRLANLPIILATSSTKIGPQNESKFIDRLFDSSNENNKQMYDSHQLPPEDNNDSYKCNLATEIDPETLCELPVPVTSTNRLTKLESSKQNVEIKDQETMRLTQRYPELVVPRSLQPIVIHHTPPVRRITEHQAQRLLSKQWNSNNSGESILVCQSTVPEVESSQPNLTNIPQKSQIINVGSSMQTHIHDQTNIVNSQNLPVYAIVSDGSSIESIKSALENDCSVLDRSNEIFVTKDPRKALSPTRTVRIKPDSNRRAIKKARLALFAQTARESQSGKSLAIPSAETSESSFEQKKRSQSESFQDYNSKSLISRNSLDSQSSNSSFIQLTNDESSFITTNLLSNSKCQIMDPKRGRHIKNELLLSRSGIPKHTYEGTAKSMMKSPTIDAFQHNLKPDQVAVVQNGTSKLTVLKISESALRHIRDSTNPTQHQDKIIPRSVRPVILTSDEIQTKQDLIQTGVSDDNETCNEKNDSINNTICESYDSTIQDDILDGPSALYNDGGDIENTSTISVTDMIRLE